VLAVVLAIAVGLLVLGVATWLFLGRLSEAERHPAARTVQEMLEVRRSQETTREPYERFFETTSVPEELAAAAKQEREADKPSLPPWERPYANAATSREATVVVLWNRDPGFEDWPVASVFRMRLSEDRWRVSDASTVTSGTVPPPLGTR